MVIRWRGHTAIKVGAANARFNLAAEPRALARGMLPGRFGRRAFAARPRKRKARPGRVGSVGLLPDGAIGIDRDYKIIISGFCIRYVHVLPGDGERVFVHPARSDALRITAVFVVDSRT